MKIENPDSEEGRCNSSSRELRKSEKDLSIEELVISEAHLK